MSYKSDTETGARITGVGFSTMAGSPDMAALPAILATAEQLGADVVELSLWDEDIISGSMIIPDRLKRLKDIMGKHTLRYTVHGPLYLNFMDARDPDRHKSLCRAFLELCGEIGVKTMVMHTGFLPHKEPGLLQDSYARQRDALHEMGDVAHACDVILCVENVFAYTEDQHTASPAKLAGEIMAIDHPNIAATLDFGHAAIQCTIDQLDYVSECRAMAPQVHHLHVHDNWGLPDFGILAQDAEAAAFGYGDLHMPVGWGDMKWDDVLPGLVLMEDSILMLELLPRYFHALEDSLSKARHFATLINGEGPP